MKSAAHRSLACLAHGMARRSLPDDVLVCARTLLLDSFGCLLGGIESAPAKACRDVSERLGGIPQARVLGTAGITSAPLAALCNGAALRFLDFNDAFSARDAAHPSGNIPPLLAVAEMQRRSGVDFLRAVATAYEIHLRFCASAGEPSLAERGWHNTTHLAIAAVTGASLLLHDDEARTSEAIAIAMTHGSTLAQIQRGEIGTIKATADGWVAKGAVEAALLAEAGVTGPQDIFEGTAGWGKAVAGVVDYAALLAPFEGDYRLMLSRIKAYASVGPSMAPVHAAIALHRKGVDPGKIQSIVVRLPAQVVNSPSVDEGKRYPQNRETADHSYPYCVVIGLLEGACGPAQFEEQKFSAPLVRRVLSCVTIEADDEFTRLRAQGVSGGSVEITLEDGRKTEVRTPYPPGHARNPLTQQDIERKFFSMAERVLGEAQAARLRDVIGRVETLPDIRELTALCVPR